MAETTALLSGVSFNEFLAGPLGSDQDYDGDGDVDTGDRFIELYNTSSTAVDLEGWQLYLDGRTLMHTFDAGDVIEAEGFFTLVNNSDGSTAIIDVGGTASFSDNSLVIGNSNSFILYNPDDDAFIYVGGVNNESLESSDLSAFSAIVSATATQVGSSEFLSESFTDGQSASREPDGNATWVNQDVTPGRTNIPDLIVDTADDNDDGDVSDGNLSLREAVQLAVDGQTIGFDDDVFTGGANSVIRLTEGQIEIDAAITIDGSTGTDIVISGDADGDDTTVSGTYITDLSASSGALSDNTRVLYVSSYGAGTTLEGLTITGGRTTTDMYDGGGVRANGAVTIVDSTISGNQTTGDEANGAGIASFADLTLTNATVSENFTTGGLSRGGGVSIEGTVTVDRQVTITNSTISGNGTTGAAVNGYGPEGGGLFGLRADISLVNGTVSGNSTTGANARGGGIYIQDGSLSVTGGTISGNSTSGSGANGGGIRATNDATVTLTNSIVLGNVAVNGSGDDVSGSATYTGGNIVGGDVFSGSTDIGDATASEVFAETEDNNGVDAGVLADNGGDVATIALLEDTDNPALDVGDLPSGVTTDAEGNSREVDQTNIDNGGTVDLGAVEVQVDIEDQSLIVTTAEDVVDATDQLTSLREAIAFANSATDADGDGNDVDTVTFDSTVFTGGANSLIRLLDGRILITDAVSIDGSTGTDIVITGDAGNDDILVTGTYITDVAASTGYLYDNGRIFNISDSDAATTINGLTLTGGYTYSSNIDGGAIRSVADLTLTYTTIRGNGTRGDGSEGGGIFSTGDVTLTDSTVSENLTVGTSSEGGGIYASGTVTVTDSTLSGNTTAGASSRGGAIYTKGDLTVTNSTISDNATLDENGDGGAIFAADNTQVTLIGSTVNGNSTAGDGSDGGAINSFGYVTLTNTTIADNSTSGDAATGGGIYAYRGASITNSTFTGNSTSGIASYGGGINLVGGANEDATVTNSLFLGNAATAGDNDIAIGVYNPTVTYVGGNIVGDTLSSDGTEVTTGITAAEVFATTHTANGVTSGVLADNGGDVQTVALLEDAANPALDVGDLPSGVTTDANGNAREIDQIGIDNGGTVDAGAVEVGELGSLIVTTAEDVVDAFDGVTSLREAIAFANSATDADADGDDVDTVTFDASVFTGGTDAIIRLTQGEIEITDTLILDGDLDDDGTGDVTISGDANADDLDASGLALADGGTGITSITESAALLTDNSRILNISSTDADTTIDGLTITGGYSTDSEGGAIRSLAALTITASTLAGNSTNGSGADGGALFAEADVSLTDSTVSDNGTTGATSRGGGLFIEGTTTLTDSTISGNTTTGSSASGGGAFVRGTLSATGSTISGNSTAEDSASGGGLLVSGPVDLTDTTVSDNRTLGDGSEGGGLRTLGALTLTSSTVSGNATLGAGSEGGGLYAVGAIALTNTTVHGNYTIGDNADGGGVYAYEAASLINSTVSGNSAQGSQSTGGGIHSYGYDGGGISLTNSIVMGNVATGGGDDLSQATGYGATIGYSDGNIVGDTFSIDGVAETTGITAAQVFAATTDNNGVDAGVLADNGGAVQTVALLESSLNPALDVGDLPSGLTTDANGNAREFDQTNIDNGGTVDAGAVEVQVDLDAASLIVTTAEDVVDYTDGLTSLREAILFANSATDADGDGDDVDTITFDASVFDGEDADIIRLTKGEIEITDAVIIDGDLENDGVADVTISGDANADDLDADGLTFAEGGSGITDVDLSSGLLSDNSRIFETTSTDADTTLVGLSMTGGYARSASVSGHGGAVNSRAELTIEDSFISGNAVASQNRNGGGVWSDQDLTITNSTISGNRALGQVATGGGVHANGVLTIESSTISGNYAGLGGGGAFGNDPVYVSDSVISDNVGGGIGGGGLYATAFTYITGSTISGNTSDGEGGGIAITDDGGLIKNSTISDNQSAEKGGGIYVVYSSLTLLGSTVSGNSTTESFGNGGGVAGQLSAMTIVNSTISGNTAYGPAAIGGGVSANDSTLLLMNSSVTGNRVLDDDSNFFGNGGGVYSDGDFSDPLNQLGDITVVNSIITGNFSSYGVNDLGIDDGEGATITYQSGNIVGDEFSIDGVSQTTGIAASDVFDQTAEVTDSSGTGIGVYAGVLADNGGTVTTVALLADLDNPALDAGDNSLLVESTLGADLNGDGDTDDTLTTDAGGFTRVVDQTAIDNGGTVDLGAAELQDVVEAQSLIVTTAEDVVDNTDGVTSLREAMTFANSATDADGDGDDVDTITFDATVFDGETEDLIRLSQGQLQINDAVVIDGDIDGDGTADVTITGDVNGDDTLVTGTLITDIDESQSTGTLSDNVRLFNIASSADDVTLTGLVLTGGYTDGTSAEGGAVRSFAEVTIIDSTIGGNATAGNDSDGGAIYTTGALTVSNSTISDNRSFGERSEGGALYSSTLTMTNSTVSGNRTFDDNSQGGGIYTKTNATITDSTIVDNATLGAGGEGGGVFSNNGSVTAINSTISGNYTLSGGSDGGGIYAKRAITLVNSTVTGNRTEVANSDGAGLASPGTDGAGITLYNSIVSGNVATLNTANDLYLNTSSGGVVTYVGGNIVGDVFSVDGVSQTTGIATASIFDTVAEIDDSTGTGTGVYAGVLADTGGDVQTSALLADADNPAVDAGDDSLLVEATVGIDLNGDGDTDDTLSTDARGFTRVVDHTLVDNGGTVDLGAYEVQGDIEEKSLIVTTAEDIDDATDGLISLREAIAFANSATDADGDGDDVDTVTFDATVFDGETASTILLTEGQLEITDSVIVDGDLDDDGVANVTIDAQGNSRIFSITDSDADSALIGLTLTSGYANNGGAVRSSAALTIQDSTVTESTANFGSNGGGGIFSSGALTIVNSTVSNNTAAGFGGGISVSSALAVIDSTIRGNGTTGTYDDGGGIRATNAVTLVNSTVSGNYTKGFESWGGGISARGIRIYNSTVSGNYTTGDDSIGGGLRVSSTLVLNNSIVMGNVAVDAGGDEISKSVGGVTTTYVGLNIVGGDVRDSTRTTIATTTAAEVFDEVTTVRGEYAGVLADNGGTVQTIALLASLDNPAIDAGDDGALVEATVGIDLNGDGDTDDTVTTDARGFTRAVDVDAIANNGSNTVDLGAFETQTEATIGPDIFEGTDSDDTQEPGAGNDLILGTDGADDIDGGEGDSDTVDYSASTAGVSISLEQSLFIGGLADGDTLTNVENIIGTEFADYIRADDSVNTLVGLGGNDILFGLDGADVLDGGDNTDLAAYTTVEDELTIDLSDSSRTSEVVAEDTWIDIEGAWGALDFSNELIGNDDDNFFIGGNAADLIKGGEGADYLSGLDGDDDVQGEAGYDVLLGGGGTDLLTGGEDPDIFKFVPSADLEVVTDFDILEDYFWFAGTGPTALADLDFTEHAAGDVVGDYTLATAAVSVTTGSGTTETTALILDQTEADLQSANFVFT